MCSIRFKPAFAPHFLFALGVGLVFAACDSNPGRPGADGSVAPNDFQGAEGIKITDSSIPFYDAAQECQGDKDCNGGVCLSGSCCPSAEQACGQVCCSTGTVCFANACVVPGKTCTSDNDCGENEYCEPALSEGSAVDAGPAPDLGPNCISGQAKSGRCLELPPRCPTGSAAPDGGVDGTPCLSECEYHPPAGLLQVTQKWRWGAKTVKAYPESIDVWSTPAVGRLADSNCDGAVDRLDPPNIIFVSGNSNGTCCQCGPTNPSACKTGVLRVLDGASGTELWSLAKPEADSIGFAGLSVAIGNVTGDSRLEIVAASGEGYVFVVDNAGKVIAKSDQPIPHFAPKSFGWGGGLALADVDGDGHVEIAYAATLFTINGTTITRKWNGSGGLAGVRIGP